MVSLSHVSTFSFNHCCGFMFYLDCSVLEYCNPCVISSRAGIIFIIFDRLEIYANSNL